MPGGISLYDNVELEHEKENLSYWMNELNLEYEKSGSYRSYYIIRVPQTSQWSKTHGNTDTALTERRF